NGTELTSNAILQWADDHKVAWHLYGACQDFVLQLFHLSSRSNFGWPLRAVRSSVAAGPRAAAWACSGRLLVQGSSISVTTTIPRGVRHEQRDHPRCKLVFGRSVIGTMMQSCASAAKLRAASPFYISAWRPCAKSGPATSDRYRSYAASSSQASNDS